LKSLYRSLVGDIISVEGQTYTLKKKEEFFLNDSKALKLSLYNHHECIFIEIKKEYALNYQIFKYKLVETLDPNPQFLTILGTNTLGYKNKKISKSDIFKKVKLKKERYDLFKHIVSKDELPEDYESKGYYHDENGNYYFFTKRYSPQIKKTDFEKKLSWEYKQDNNIRLLIETDFSKRSKIHIYKGKELKPTQIRPYNSLETSQQQERNQIPNTHHRSLAYL